MVTETANNDNGINDPESDAGDSTDGVGNGELGDFLNFKFGANSGSLSAISGMWQTVGTAAPNAPTASGFEYCFGEFDGSGACVLGTADDNLAQTDSLTADVEFYAVQTRNNADFRCSDLNGGSTDPNDGEVNGASVEVITTEDLASSLSEVENDPTSWFFYNDTNDSVMTQNEFTATGGANKLVAFAGSVNGAAYMKLDNGTDPIAYQGSQVGKPRYNIATARFGGVALSSITDLMYRVYDDSVSSQTPFLHFNVDFDGSNTFQGRLVQVPGTAGNAGVPVDTWTQVDAIGTGDVMWTWSRFDSIGGVWPAQTGTAFTNDTDRYQTWDDILAAYPSIETLGFLGVRVGHPGPIAEESYVDSIQFNNTVYQFNN